MIHICPLPAFLSYLMVIKFVDYPHMAINSVYEQFIVRNRRSPVEIVPNTLTYLGVDANDLVALLARIGEHILVALDAVRMIVPDDVTLSGEALVALPAAEVSGVPVLVHGFCVLATEN